MGPRMLLYLLCKRKLEAGTAILDLAMHRGKVNCQLSVLLSGLCAYARGCGVAIILCV